jgi:hypothetical protein
MYVSLSHCYGAPMGLGLLQCTSTTTTTTNSAWLKVLFEDFRKANLWLKKPIIIKKTGVFGCVSGRVCDPFFSGFDWVCVGCVTQFSLISLGVCRVCGPVSNPTWKTPNCLLFAIPGSYRTKFQKKIFCVLMHQNDCISKSEN